MYNDTRALVLVLMFALLAAGKCADFGDDGPAVVKVQASWGPGEALMQQHQYARALAELQSTKRYLPEIQNVRLRECVADGAQIRIVSAQAGRTYLEHHPRDVAGAQLAADRAQRAFPMRHDCP